MTPVPPMPGPDPLVGRVLDGRYRIEALVARGGMATVYRAVDQRLDRTVAVKVMHPSFAIDPGFVGRFQREARAAARLSSPYVVSVHDQGADEGNIYLVMEFVPGHTARDVLRHSGALPPEYALAIIDSVLRALAAAHTAGYIHRDVKPENVLISEDGRVKMTDFGLARAIEAADHGRTQGMLLGTVAYLSPEQVEHNQVDERSDVYSAGILLFEMITGQVPFIGKTPMQVAYRHVHEDVPAPASVRTGVLDEIDRIVVKATRRDPAQRYRDASAFLDDVTELRKALPPATPWAPTPHDTLVVDRGAPGMVDGAGAAIVAGAAGAAIVAGSDGDDTASMAPQPQTDGTHGDGVQTDGTQADAADAAEVAAPDDATQLDTPGLTEVTPMASDSLTEVTPLDMPGMTEATQLDLPGLPTAAALADSDGARPDESDTPTPRRRRRGMIALGLVALMATVLALLVLFGPLQRVTVPNVLGSTPAEATELLATANLLIDSSQSAFSEDYPKGQVMSTDPGPDSSARTGSTVMAVVSKGPERYKVPDLTGMTTAEASTTLGATKLSLGAMTEVYDDTIKTGLIVDSKPAAGESVKPATVIAVNVSKGRKPVEIPNLVGADAGNAETALEEAGLVVQRDERYSDTVTRGLVISLNPAPGTTAYSGDTVTMSVSLGPELVSVPSVVGQTEKAATEALRAAGFDVKINKPGGTSILGVYSQNPGGGTKAPRGSTVTLVVY